MLLAESKHKFWKRKEKKIPRIISTAAEASTENTLLWLCFILKKNRQTRAKDIL